jgi:hypothetical protein
MRANNTADFNRTVSTHRIYPFRVNKLRHGGKMLSVGSGQSVGDGL